MFIRLLLAVFVLLTNSCEKKENFNSGKPIVLVSVPPYIDFVKKIAQDTVTVQSLIPAGANPHVYEAAPKEVQSHQNAAIWVRLGESFDKKVYQFFKQLNKPVQIVDVAEGIDLLSICDDHGHVTDEEHCHSHDEGRDLHIWLSPKLAKPQAEKIAAALIALMPEQQEFFSANLQKFLSELEDVDQQITALLAPMEGKAILVSHPAFGYFCQDYHLVQLSIEMEGKEPLPQHVTEILSLAKHYAIQAVLVEPQYSNKGAELIAKRLGLPTHSVDPYAENYLENLIAIAQVISHG